MALKISEMVFQRVYLALSIEAAIKTHLADIAQGYGDYLVPVVREDEELIDTLMQLEYLLRRVAGHREALESLDEEVNVQEVGKMGLSFETGKLTQRVEAKLRAVRRAFQGLFDPKWLATVGLKGTLPRRAWRLYDRTRMVQVSLENPNLDFAPVLRLADPMSLRMELANQLEPELTELGAAIDASFTERHDTEEVRARRRQLMATFDHDVRAILHMLQGMFRLAGRDDLAEGLRWSKNIGKRHRRSSSDAVDPAASGT